MFGNLLRAEFKKVRFMHVGLACAAFYAVVALIYLFAHDGSWVSAPAPDGRGWWGFLPDPTYDLVFAESGYPLDRAVACASVAHTVFFPVIALAFVHQLYFADLQGRGAQVAFARGASRFRFLCAKLAAATVVLQGCYLLFSIATAAVYLAVCQPASLASAVGALGGKLLLNCLVNESFIVFCMGVFSWVDNGPAATGIVFVSTIVGLVAQLAMGGVDLPVHMGYWVKASGSSIEPAVALSTAAFSLASFALFAVAAYGGMLRGEGRRA